MARNHDQNGVCIGSNAKIMPSQVVDDVFDAGWVVTKNIAAAGRYVGNPVLRVACKKREYDRGGCPLADLQQYQTKKGEIDGAIAAVICDNGFIRGPYVDAFEQEFASTA